MVTFKEQRLFLVSIQQIPLSLDYVTYTDFSVRFSTVPCYVHYNGHTLYSLKDILHCAVSLHVIIHHYSRINKPLLQHSE